MNFAMVITDIIQYLDFNRNIYIVKLLTYNLI